MTTKGGGWMLAGVDTDVTRYLAEGRRRAGRRVGRRCHCRALPLRRRARLMAGRAPTARHAEGRGGDHAVGGGARRVVEDRADALLAAGRAAEAVAELEAAVSVAPLRERRWGQLMTALYQAGRQGEALRCVSAGAHDARRRVGRGARPRAAASRGRDRGSRPVARRRRRGRPRRRPSAHRCGHVYAVRADAGGSFRRQRRLRYRVVSSGAQDPPCWSSRRCSRMSSCMWEHEIYRRYLDAWAGTPRRGVRQAGHRPLRSLRRGTDPRAAHRRHPRGDGRRGTRAARVARHVGGRA